MNRRKFFASSATAAIGFAAASLLAACGAPQTPPASPPPNQGGVPPAAAPSSWLGPNGSAAFVANWVDGEPRKWFIRVREEFNSSGEGSVWFHTWQTPDGDLLTVADFNTLYGDDGEQEFVRRETFARWELRMKDALLILSNFRGE